MSPRRLMLMAALWLMAATLSADPLVPLAVVPFVNLSHYQGHLLERRAAAAVAAEAAGPWAPVDPALVQRTLDDMPVPWPLGTAEIQALCARLPATLAINGAISTAQADQNSARAVLNLELLEPLSGEVVGTAQAEGRAQSRDPLPRDALLDQALQQAAKTALQRLGRAPYAVGKVATGPTAQSAAITLSGGAGLQAKSILLLLRAGDSPGLPLAAAEVQNLSSTTAQVRILAQREPLSGGEIAICVGRLP